jgi:MoxR-like ATPase
MFDLKKALDRVVAQMSQVILGKELQIRLALTCLMARGHVLIEDQPGVGKTTLAHALARVLGLSFQRIQFTSDLLPADILGVSIYDKEVAQFKFHPGPIFAQMVLADEVNRATPKTQSALLEAMEEHQVTVEGETRPLPVPFFVLATQNPLHQIGTFPLPESQLDRFMMRLELGYPDHNTERALLKGEDRREIIAKVTPTLTIQALLDIQKAVPQVHVADALIDYLQAILEFSRQSSRYRAGLSPRAGLAVLHCAQAWALMHGRDHVVPEDVQTVLPGVIGHRLVAMAEQQNSQALVKQLIEMVEIP